MTNSYSQILERLFGMSASSEIKLNLEIPWALSAFLGHPQRAYPTIHVAGTNGKGSTVTKIAKALECAGLKVGLYTSPHIESYRQRISMSGAWIPEEEVVALGGKLLRFIDEKKIPATFFELTTLLAFDYFRQEKVDVAVIEVGLGGRLDATNILAPLLTVITSISVDHADLLGNTLEAIAREKAGILKPGTPLVLGPHARISTIAERAEELECPVFHAKEVGGFYDEENREIARTALEVLAKEFPLSPAAIEKGLLERPACRFERRGECIFDVAHNPDGFSRLVAALDEFYPQEPIFALVGMCKDKDFEACLGILARRVQRIFLVKADTPRAATPAEMGEALRAQGFKDYVWEDKFSSTAVRAMEERRASNAKLLVCGSFFIMQEALRIQETV